MKVLRVPRNLAWLSWCYWSIPLLLAFHVAAASRVEWWKLPWRAVGIAGLVGAVFAAWLFWGTRRHRIWVPVSARVFLVAWVGVAGWITFRELSTSLAVFSVALLGFTLGLLSLIDRERARSFLDPRMRWFEGKPRLIPNVQARVFPLPEEADRTKPHPEDVPWRAARFDREGVFLFASDSHCSVIPFFVLQQPRVKIEISHRGSHIECQAEPIAALHSRLGVGFRLLPVTLEQSTSLGRLVESVGGEGYAEI